MIIRVSVPGIDVPDHRGRTGLDRVGRGHRQPGRRRAGRRTARQRLARAAEDHLIEAAAGLLDDDAPEVAVRREVEEELGVSVGEVQHVFDVFMRPGSVTERLHFFAGPYRPVDRTAAGGGIEEEGEDIEVLELPFDQALAMVDDGRIADAKTIMLPQWAALRGPFRT